MNTHPNRYIADAKFCFCKNNKRIIIMVTSVAVCTRTHGTSADARSGKAGERECCVLVLKLVSSTHKVQRCRPLDSCLVRSTDLQDSALRIARCAERPRDHLPGDVRVHARPVHDSGADSGGVCGPDGAEGHRGRARQAAACVQECSAQFSTLALKYWTLVSRVPPRSAASRFRPV